MSFIAGAALIGGAATLGGAYLGAKSSSSAAKKQAGASKYAAELERLNRTEDRAEGARQYDASLAFGKDRFGLQKQQFGADQDRQAALQKAYYDMQNQGGQIAGSGEGGFMNSVNAPSAQLGQQEQDILSGQNEGMQNIASQTSANLAQQGVRGGQAATQLNRATGSAGQDAIKDINRLKYEDEARKQSQMAAYQASKSQAGMGAQLRPASF